MFLDIITEFLTILNFDATKLQYVSSSTGSFIPNATLMDSIAGGSVTLDVAGMGTSSCASGTGTIITVVFDTKPAVVLISPLGQPT